MAMPTQQKYPLMIHKPIFRILDLCCGDGGSAVGYAKALEALGYKVEILGIDIERMEDYPYFFIQDDVVDFIERTPYEWFQQFDLIHASPPCQWASITRELAIAQGNMPSDINIMPEIRIFLKQGDIPYVIENVVKAWACERCNSLRMRGENAIPGCKECKEVRKPHTILCGSSFDLAVQRHRMFETSFPIEKLPCNHKTDSWPIGPKGKPKPIGIYHSLNDYVGMSKWKRWDEGGRKGPEPTLGGWTAKTLEEAQQAMGISHISTWKRLKEAIPPAYTEHIAKCFIDWRDKQPKPKAQVREKKMLDAN